jgi:DNA-binding beta-propeller fold protein YncE
MRRALYGLAIGIGCVVAAGVHTSSAGKDTYEVWGIDQSNSPGKTFGGTIYIWDGHDLENTQRAKPARVTKVDLGGEAAAFCFAATGVNPVRPHMLAINPSQTHAIVSFVASGHVLFLDAARRTPVACIRASVGAGGARQVHMAVPSPDETYVTFANQNGKRFERILTNYATNAFVHDIDNGIDLANCTTPNGQPCEQFDLRRDNAPICPITESTSRFTFVTLRGGGLFVVDSKASPMQIVGEYDRATVHGNGCLGAEVPGKMYIDSGGGTAGNLFEADLYAFPTTGYSALNPPNTPLPKVVFSEDVEEADAHGAALTKHGKYLWIADRGRNFLWVVDTVTDLEVNRVSLTPPGPSDDATPDLMMLSPNGSHAFMSLRGPNPLTADPHVSTGSTPGVGIVKVLESGRNGFFEAVAGVTNIDAAGVERADVHALAIRRR